MSQLEAHRGAAVRLLNRGVVGSPTARYLIVGERTGLQPNPQAIDLAFYSAERCSHYLNACLWEAGYRESELAFTNAYRADGKPRNLAPWPGTTIALGGLAQRRLDLLQYRYYALPHPAYQVRFKKRERWRYVELLRSFREEA